MTNKKRQKTVEDMTEEKTPSCCCEESCCEGENPGGQKSMLSFVAVILLLINLVVGFFVYKEITNIPQKVETELSYLMQMGGDVSLYREFKDVATQMTDKEAVKKQLEAMKKQLEAKNKPNTTNNETMEQKQTTTPPKADKPVADLFIMSYCPFGLQAQKAYLEVMEKLGNVADINVKFVHYLMHGAEERDENTRQRCIQKDQKSKYVAYAKCFVEAGKSAECIKKAGIDEVQLQGCMDLMNQRYAIMQDFADGGQYPRYGVNAEESQKYGVAGSPTFVLNGVKIENIGRDATSYAKAICDSFTVKPKECEQTFSTTTFDPMFGWTSNGSPTNANCGN